MEPILYVDRASGETRTEQVYGERWLRWTYETGPGRATLLQFARRAVFSRWYGWRMNRPVSAQKVLPFVIDYGLDAEEFDRPATAYDTFNEFFYRGLRSGARPIAAAADPAVAVLPADGRHLAYPDVDAADGFYVKGKKFTLTELLGDAALGAEFAGGSMVISRLCPVDYHRFHFPVGGTPSEARLINGELFSVSPIALRLNPGYLVQNKRMITLVESERFGRVAVLEIGATCVGSITQTYVPGRAVSKGDEKGCFAFGGSCVITVFARGRIRFDDDLAGPAASQREVYAKIGERLGVATS